MLHRRAAITTMGLMLHRRAAITTMPPAAQLPPLEDENLLREILARLPPLPSSLPRASLVCKRWLGSVSDPGFFRSFREHHGKPPLLGFFFVNGRGADFVPSLDQPDRIPAVRFSLPPQSHSEQCWLFRDCRHGLCLFIDRTRPEAIVCDPITNHQRRIALPREFSANKNWAFFLNGGVVCVAGHGQVHGDCSLSPFKLVLLYNNTRASSVSACLYESESGVWGNIASITMPGAIAFITPSILVGIALCWLSREGNILEFDIGNQSLGVTEKPEKHQNTKWNCCRVLRTQENRLGLVVLTGPYIEIWAREVNSDGFARLVLQKTVELHKLLQLGPSTPWTYRLQLQGFDLEIGAIFLSWSI
ncbi:hypothetical protein ACQ4PT_067292 [Festuca glaucescens]